MNGGVFLRDRIREVSEFLLAWLLSAAILVFISAALIELCGISIELIGFFSSAISLLCALAAGTMIRGKLIRAVISGAAFSLLLIILGWMISGSFEKMNGIVSVIPFTITGTVFGSVLSSGNNKKVNSVNIKKMVKIK